jgi:predicted DNA-binding transcriptional regulator AlpA
MAVQPPRPNLAQERFNQQYITSAEIAAECHVSRPSVMRARERRMLPEPIAVGEGNIYIWERQTVRPFIDAWKLTLAAKRGQIA